MNQPQKVKALFVSDVHLGSEGCNAKAVIETLKRYEPEILFLVGDIVDGWLLSKRFYWPQEHTNVLRKILSYSKKGTRVIYVPGNHDEFLRQYCDFTFGNIEIHNEYLFEGAYVVHGDAYDGVVQLSWLGMLGSMGYDAAIVFDRYLKKLGYKKSVSKWLKDRIKEAVKFITNFERELAKQAKQRGCHTVICGHIHKAEDKTVDGVRYINTGDWVESFTYVTYNDGKYELHSTAR